MMIFSAMKKFKIDGDVVVTRVKKDLKDIKELYYKNNVDLTDIRMMFHLKLLSFLLNQMFDGFASGIVVEQL